MFDEIINSTYVKEIKGFSVGQKVILTQNSPFAGVSRYPKELYGDIGKVYIIQSIWCPYGIQNPNFAQYTLYETDKGAIRVNDECFERLDTTGLDESKIEFGKAYTAPNWERKEYLEKHGTLEVFDFANYPCHEYLPELWYDGRYIKYHNVRQRLVLERMCAAKGVPFMSLLGRIELGEGYFLWGTCYMEPCCQHYWPEYNKETMEGKCIGIFGGLPRAEPKTKDETPYGRDYDDFDWSEYDFQKIIK